MAVWLKKIGRVVPLALLLMAAGCERFTGHAVRDWSEDVPLEDGPTIVVDRHVEFNASNSIAGDTYSARESESTISFRDAEANVPTWSFPLLPLVLFKDQTNSEWVVVATTTNCDTWKAWYEPQPKYWEFRLKGATWSEVPLSETSFGRRTNLFIGYGPGLPAKHVTVALTKRYMDNTPVDPIYRSIRSDAISNCQKSGHPKTRI